MIHRHDCALGNPVPSNIGIRRHKNPRDTVLLIQNLYSLIKDLLNDTKITDDDMA